MIIIKISIEKKLNECNLLKLIKFMEKCKNENKILMISFHLSEMNLRHLKGFLSHFMVNLALKHVDLSTLSINFEIDSIKNESEELFLIFFQTLPQNLKYIIVLYYICIFFLMLYR